MGAYTVRNGVPTAEQMGEFLGLSSKRVSAVRSIIEAPVKSRSSKTSSYRGVARKAAAKKTAARKTAAKK